MQLETKAQMKHVKPGFFNRFKHAWKAMKSQSWGEQLESEHIIHEYHGLYRLYRTTKKFRAIGKTLETLKSTTSTTTTPPANNE